MPKRGGGLFADGIGLGLDYEAYKNSNSVAGFFGYRMLYGIILVLVVLVPFVLLGMMTKKTPKQEHMTPKLPYATAFSHGSL